jgi:hypothetical protein
MTIERRAFIAGFGAAAAVAFPQTASASNEARGPFLDAFDFGALGDNSHDDTTAIQAAIDAAQQKGGVVYLRPGAYLLSAPIVLPAKVRLVGAGSSATTLRLAAGSNCNVIQSTGLEELVDSNRWSFTEGVPSGFSVEHLRIDGNKTHNEVGNGIRFYGKRFQLFDLIIFDCAENGIYTDCAYRGVQNGVEDLPESEIDLVWVRTCGKDGILYRGPHDGHIGRIYTAVNAGRGFATEASNGTGGHYYQGACDLAYIHSYANGEDGVYFGAKTGCSYLQTESNLGRGLYVGAGPCRIGLLWDHNNNRRFTPPWSDPPAPDAAIASTQIEHRAAIGTVEMGVPYGCTGLRIANNYGVTVGNILIDGFSNEFGGVGLDIQGDRVDFGNAIILNFRGPSGTALKINGSAIRGSATIDNCETSVDHASANPNRLDLRVSAYVDSGQVGVVTEGVVGALPNPATGRFSYQILGTGIGLMNLSNSAVLDFPMIAPQSHAELTVQVSGAATGDPVALGVPATLASSGLIFSAWVTRDGVVTVRAHNYTAGPIEPDAGEFAVAVVR